MKLLIAIIIATVGIMLSGCETMKITGSIGYIDPSSGAKAGMSMSDEGGGWWVRVPWATDVGDGRLLIEGEIPVIPEK